MLERNKESVDSNVDEGCSAEQVNVNCNVLGTFLQTLLVNGTHFVNMIDISNQTNVNSAAQAGLFLEVQQPPNRAKTLVVFCSVLCIIRNAWTILAEPYLKYVVFVLENISFADTVINFSNIVVHIKNVTLHNITITDIPVMWSNPFRQTDLIFINVQFENSQLLCSTPNSWSIKLHLRNCSFFHSTIDLDVYSIWFEVHGSTISSSVVVLEANYMIKSLFENTFIHNGPDQQNLLELSFSSPVLYLKFSQVSLINSDSAISVTKYYSGVHSLLQVYIENSTFFNNSEEGIGAALHLDFFVPCSACTSHSLLLVNASTFAENQVHRNGKVSASGGAIAVTTNTGFTTGGDKVTVYVIDSTFTNNYAQDGGGALFLSDEFIDAKILHCTFFISEQSLVSPAAVFILAESDIAIKQSFVEFKLVGTVQPLMKVEMKTSLSHIHSLDFTISCSAGYTMSVGAEFGSANKQLERFIPECQACMPSYYFPTDGVYKVSYQPNTSLVSISNPNFLSNDLICMACPYGGDCSDGSLRSRPSFWGYEQGSGIVFQQCPTGYCCSGSTDSLCERYNTCSGNREGTLCGTCRHGYSLSLLSNNCVPDTSCGQSWFWVVTVIAMTTYMLWYTFKDDILRIPQTLWKCVHENKDQMEEQMGPQDEDVDKGYFGILIFFVQAVGMMRLAIDSDTSEIRTDTAEKAEAYIGLLLNVELTYFSTDLCALQQLDTTKKTIFKYIFQIGIYVSWFAVAFLYLLLKCCGLQKKSCWSQQANVLKLKFIKGLLEVLKYTYSGFTGIVFMSIACVTIGNDSVWFYDGTVSCFNLWQKSMIVFCFVYVLPFPVILVFGLKLLRLKQISNPHFVAGCFIPLPFAIVWIKMLCSMKNKVFWFSGKNMKNANNCFDVTNMSDVTEEILGNLQGPYKTEQNISEYWESVMILRRLLLAATVLISNSVIQLGACLVLCCIFLVHHNYKQPFANLPSNYVESLSLMLLCVVAATNFFKSIYINLGLSPEGIFMETLVVMKLIESLGIFVLIAFVLLLELITQGKKRTKST